MLDNRILYSSFLENIYFPRNRLRECDNCNKNENVNRESKDVASKSIEYIKVSKRLRIAWQIFDQQILSLPRRNGYQSTLNVLNERERERAKYLSNALTAEEIR